MTERDEFLASIVRTTADYRQSVLGSPTLEHVDRWVKQFDDSVQLQILQEMDHVLKKTYFSRKKVEKFLEIVFKKEKLVGDDPCVFWKNVKFLDIQINDGTSQKNMLTLFDAILEKRCGFQTSDCGAASNKFIYLDDAIFSGGRVKQDFENWIKEAPNKAEVHVIVIALHQGYYYNRDLIKEMIRESGKDIVIHWHFGPVLENRKSYKDESDVLWPTEIPDEAREYVDNLKLPLELRRAGQTGSLGIFSSDTGRRVLEQEFLKAGVKIRKMCPNLNKNQRPLGNRTLETPGFGSLIVTFRNCPNNTPLALWVDSPWYPLFPRVPNAQKSQQEGGF